MSDEHDKAAVTAHLEARGFAVEEIPRTNRKTSDLVTRLAGKVTFVEIKARRHDEVLRSAMEAVPVGATQSIETPIEKHSTLSAEIRKASEQLESDAGPDDFRVLWFRANRSLFLDAPHSQFIATLLGARHVMVGDGRPRMCVYADHADFHRRPELDCAVVETDDLLRIFTNEFSPRHTAFQASAVLQALRQSARMVNLREGEARGECFFVEGADVDRAQKDQVLAYLRAKYPKVEFLGFVENTATTTVTTLDARAGRSPREPQ